MTSQPYARRPPKNAPEVARAQKLRLQRMVWGLEAWACTVLMVVALCVLGILPARKMIEYFAASVAINLVFFGLLLSGLNLRLREPSMTAAQIVAAIGPPIYVMYFLSDAGARSAFLLMFVAALLFGMFALNRRAMLAVGGLGVAAYVALIAVLAFQAPERVDLRVEVVVVFAYSAVLAIVAKIGSYLAGLRAALKDRIADLQQAVVAIEELAAKDPLTGLLNRRSMMRQLEQERARVARRQAENRTLCIGLIDIDHFKRINDTLGHQSGDHVLRRIAHALAGTIRKGDLCGRFGGEEFILVLPETTPDRALIACERLRRTVRELEIPELAGDTVTVSLGLAVHQPGEDVETTLRRADGALYRAKAGGRDQVVTAEVAIEEAPRKLPLEVAVG